MADQATPDPAIATLGNEPAQPPIPYTAVLTIHLPPLFPSSASFADSPSTGTDSASSN